MEEQKDESLRGEDYPAENIAKQVDALNRKYRELREMTGTILATIRVNVLRGTLPKEIGDLADVWHKRWMGL